MAAVRQLIPMVHVADVRRSIAFYARLGFVEGDNTYTPDGETEPTWTHLETADARLMLVRANAPVDPERQAVIFYMYSDDVAAYRDALKRKGVAVGEMEFPFWAPGGEFRVTDPDGYALMVRHM
jgi:catechol 2,3-dioxygenase-like lactoylglutathione lyase family enzyme